MLSSGSVRSLWNTTMIYANTISYNDTKSHFNEIWYLKTRNKPFSPLGGWGGYVFPQSHNFFFKRNEIHNVVHMKNQYFFLNILTKISCWKLQGQIIYFLHFSGQNICFMYVHYIVMYRQVNSMYLNIHGIRSFWWVWHQYCITLTL